jgi:hypothetical protein
MHTIDEAKSWVSEHRKELISSLISNKEVPEFMKEPGNRFEEVWCVGFWLHEVLEKHGATKDEIFNIGFAHGQRSLFGDTYKWALHYANEFENKGNIKDKPGIELADKINNIHLQSGNGFIGIAIEENS